MNNWRDDDTLSNIKWLCHWAYNDLGEIGWSSSPNANNNNNAWGVNFNNGNDNNNNKNNSNYVRAVRLVSTLWGNLSSKGAYDAYKNPKNNASPYLTPN